MAKFRKKYEFFGRFPYVELKFSIFGSGSDISTKTILNQVAVRKKCFFGTEFPIGNLKRSSFFDRIVLMGNPFTRRLRA